MTARAGAGVSLAIVLVACAEDDPRPRPSSDATVYAAVYCSRLDRCQGRNVRNTFGDLSTCVERLAPDIDDEMRSAGASVSRAQIEECGTAMNDAPCDVLTSALPACNFAGLLDDGVPCGSGYQCKSTSCFRPADGEGNASSCGRCSARAPLSGDCTNANCEAGLTCASGRCKAFSELGAICDELAAPCRPTLRCVRGRCEAALREGAACTPTALLDPGVIPCEPSLYCARDETCAPIRYAAVGEACDQGVVCTGSSCSGGTCVADLREGASCVMTDAACEVPLGCVQGRCARVSISACR